MSESDGGRGDQRSTHRQTPCWPPLGCLRPREHATRTLAVCHWRTHTAASNKSGHHRCRARAAIKRRSRFAISNAPDNAVYDTHSLRTVKDERVRRRDAAAIMQHSYHADGHAPPTNGTSSQASHQGDHGWLRTPTVAEALPFTPFSSIVPFNPGKTLCGL